MGCDKVHCGKSDEQEKFCPHLQIGRSYTEAEQSQNVHTTNEYIAILI